eukprot:CAMPEP_0117660428 /NCGR_PEP_ID=MMETSP0804-20121206/6963_1 /TAXON_ID=1074897 /ORGANISM="Tetraselmis astigmatica, Strain CCMP880" /LENGTH=111 /DNA_ID=CAMNT_0005467157 /DNA_START=508 /DNA_END=843 /DNA_ORIENTATION=-
MIGYSSFQLSGGQVKPLRDVPYELRLQLGAVAVEQRPHGGKQAGPQRLEDTLGSGYEVRQKVVRLFNAVCTQLSKYPSRISAHSHNLCIHGNLRTKAFGEGYAWRWPALPG